MTANVWPCFGRLLKRSELLVTAILKFEIRNTFAEWEQAFYSHQPIARAAGMFEIYHGHEPDDEMMVCVVLNTLSPEHMQKFI